MSENTIIKISQRKTTFDPTVVLFLTLFVLFTTHRQLASLARCVSGKRGEKGGRRRRKKEKGGEVRPTSNTYTNVLCVDRKSVV